MRLLGLQNVVIDSFYFNFQILQTFNLFEKFFASINFRELPCQEFSNAFLLSGKRPKFAEIGENFKIIQKPLNFKFNRLNLPSRIRW